MYLPACTNGSDRAKHGSSRACSSARLAAARLPSTMAAAAAPNIVIRHTVIIAGRLPTRSPETAQTKITD